MGRELQVDQSILELPVLTILVSIFPIFYLITKAGPTFNTSYVFQTHLQK